MESTGYITLTRQAGLKREMQVVANNIANSSTTGFRAEGVIFSEYVKSVDGGPSLSMGQGNVGKTSFEQGGLEQTNGTFDFAIEGDGYFVVQTPLGDRLTRAGSFSPNAAGELVTPDGFPVLDNGRAPLFIPAGAGTLSVSADGTLSMDGNPLGQMAIVRPLAPNEMVREDGVMFRADAGDEPAEEARVLQGFTEGSNVNPLLELSRLIEVQRAYEMGQSFLKTEDERVRAAVKTLTETN
ncbi:flagellar hook-basal body complex protein [Sulfitobacter donghicola]|uniref:Flagellar basal-body rod protein FlgF n=1 Tax=Sulfitobacter donghicola DSW-25 = KCTC 12864 = JCM 14565 TaxID=1300350 RepID=A0A073IYV5_9RHOB|nr:flagellar hook-basal body complex protein [Sulfitobacter donghicola]KEJ90552.1 flagellar basal body rod protein FlgF [Sulfitobacter donghicola DSW-25 = KCTC 12864 = JCM 14565]KIN67797.1 Flagellar basal-body rod protein FlgF [Sulfitobacter donghicola DSW-25 = KCTC 12864 = JCM 14565]